MLKNYGYLLKSLDMNKINQLFAERQGRKLLSLYFCAGCPTLEGTADVIKTSRSVTLWLTVLSFKVPEPLP